MKKLRLRPVLVVLFASFLMLALLETMTNSPETEAKTAAEDSALEVPITGSAEKPKTAETFETLFEIAFLALVGTGFYILNAKEVLKRN